MNSNPGILWDLFCQLRTSVCQAGFAALNACLKKAALLSGFCDSFLPGKKDVVGKQEDIERDRVSEG
jgi:hypothetical protein